MDNDFKRTFGMTFDEAVEIANRKKKENRIAEEEFINRIANLKHKQSLRSKLNWYQNLAKRKRELLELRAKNEIQRHTE